MTQRLDYTQVSPDAFRALLHTEQQVHRSGLEPALLELVKTRASQLNGCAYCLDMHTKDARARGETEQRLYVLPAWREAPFYSERERAALAWTEAVTRIGEAGVPDALYAEARRQFDERELVDLTLAVIAINGWNRMAIAFRSAVGGYVSPHGAPAAPAGRPAARSKSS
ncbi:MAG TPA: carboxymuconolactone decarboxylase family protein [Gemmatimonadales bacterium]|jgi:AhpD family alkylhydroperoxidase|nr:carboxymuconolactone decarboxylase family protein [Gemmatimonadales bacterium]